MGKVVFFVTLLICSCFSSTVAITCGDNEYIHNGRCCKKCPKGFYVHEHCNNDTTPTLCQPCEGKAFETNNKCQCPPYQYYSEALLGCTPCHPCPAGKFSPNVCKSSRICRECPKGHYSNLTKNYKPSCTKSRQCTKYKRECNTTHNAICDVITTTIPTTNGSISEGTSAKENDVTAASDEQDSFDDFHKVLIAVIVIGLVLFLCLTICCIVRRKQNVVCQGPVRWRSLPDESATYETLNTGLLLRDQPANIHYKLHEYLNPPGPQDWKILAATLGFKHIEISNFEVDRKTAAERMLASWQTKDNATVDLLYCRLKQIGREDAARFLRENLVANESESLV